MPLHYLQQMRLEAIEDEDPLGSLKGCRMVVCNVPGRANLDQALVQIWPAKPEEDHPRVSDS